VHWNILVVSLTNVLTVEASKLCYHNNICGAYNETIKTQ